MRSRLGWLAVVMLCAGLAPAAEPPPSDIVTLENGNIYSGWFDGAPLVLETEYGRIRLPWAWLRSLRRGDDGGPDRVRTADGSRLRGRLVAADLELERVLAPRLTVHVADLAAIDFGRREATPPPAPDVVALRNGDVLRLSVTGPAPAAGAAEWAVLDVAQGYDGLQGQWTGRDGARGNGPVQWHGLQVRLPGGQALILEPAVVESVGLRVPAGGDPARALLRHRFPGEPGRRWFRDPLDQDRRGPAMVRVPAGQYRRGDLQGDGDPDERPVQTVTLERPFAIGVFEVTFDDYAAFCRATGRRLPADSGWGRGARPVVNVSWEDAVAYTEWLSAVTGHRYRLPTQAEWEYAARAGTETRFWWGQEMAPLRANCADCSTPWESERSAPVGRFAPNPFGLYDTSGNVWEWVQDCYQPSYEGEPVDGRAAERRCGKRVIRGGAWSFPAGEARSASRWRDFPARASDDTGFRVVRELSPSPH